MDTDIIMTGKELKEARKQILRLKQCQYAKIVGAHFTTISDWERQADRPIPHCAAILTRLMAADHALQRRVEDMVGGI
ncbi:MAG TPA: hypothetical protein VI358_18165 [Pseudolabrys sp.]